MLLSKFFVTADAVIYYFMTYIFCLVLYVAGDQRCHFVTTKKCHIILHDMQAMSGIVW